MYWLCWGGRAQYCEYTVVIASINQPGKHMHTLTVLLKYFNSPINKLSLLGLLIIPCATFSQILIDTSFVGANANLLSVNNVTNTIRVEPNLRYGDVRKVTFYFGISGFDQTMPLNIQIQSTHPPVLAAYSYDKINWERIGGTSMGGYKEYTDTFTQSPVYFSTGYPYLYHDVVNLANSLSANLHVTISDLTTSENGKAIKMFRITDSCVVDSTKDLIWVIGRSHAMESHSSYVVDGLIEFLASSDTKAVELRKKAIVYVVPMMDVDMVEVGGTGKDQNPVDFNRDWSSPSHWNAVNAVKNKIVQTAMLNPLRIFLDCHNPFPNAASNNTWFYTSYASGPQSDNLTLYRKLMEAYGGYPINSVLGSATAGLTARGWADSTFTGIDFSTTLETGWVDRTDNVEWTIPLYRQHGKVVGEAMNDYILPTEDIIIDNIDTLNGFATSGQWSTSSFVEGFWGINYLHDSNSGQGTKSAQFTPDVPITDDYEVFLLWSANANRADNVPVRIAYNGGIKDTTVNQQITSGWASLGVFNFAAGSTGYVKIENLGTTGTVVADAVRLSRPINCASTVSINPIPSQLEDALIKIYPNPAGGIYSIEIDKNIGNGAVAIYNFQGEKVFESSIQEIRNSTIDISNEPNGVYLLSVRTEKSNIAYKIVKQK